MRFRAFANLDLSACVENILLEAVHLDLGAVWLGVAPYASRELNVRRAIGIPQGLTAFAVIPFGYADDKFEERTREDRYDTERVHYI